MNELGRLAFFALGFMAAAIITFIVLFAVGGQ